MKLAVKKSFERDSDSGVVRIHSRHRADIRRGDICRLSTNAKSKLIAVRGLSDGDMDNIRLDFQTRQYFGLEAGNVYEFRLSKVCFLQKFFWQWNAPDPTIRTAAQVSLVSLFCGVLSLVIAVAAVC